MQSVKESAANVAASAKSGMEKTKAVAQEKMERMTAKNPTEKEMATDKKEERIHQAELHKQEVRERNAGPTNSYSTTGEAGQSTGIHQMSSHGTGQPAGQVTDGVIESHPIGTATGTERSTTAHNTHVGPGTNQGYATGGAYSG